MPNIFIAKTHPSAEAALQRSFDQSVHQLTQLTRRLMAWQPQPRDDFPTPDLSEIAGPPDQPPDALRAQLQTRTVAATAAILTEAYGEGGQYQAQGYTIQSSPTDGNATAYQVVDRPSRQQVLAFERDSQGELSVQDNQLSEEQTQDFLQVARRITEEGFEPIETDITGQLQHEVLGALAPAGTAAQTVKRLQSRESPPVQSPPVQSEPGSSVTALDLVQWRYASIVLGRNQQQVNRITVLAQAAGEMTGQSFLTLYRKDRTAPLPLQPSPQEVPLMQRDIQQLKDLVWQVGPQQVEQLYHTQRRLNEPVPIGGNQQVIRSDGSHPKPAPLDSNAQNVQPER